MLSQTGLRKDEYERVKSYFFSKILSPDWGILRFIDVVCSPLSCPQDPNSDMLPLSSLHKNKLMIDQQSQMIKSNFVMMNRMIVIFVRSRWIRDEPENADFFLYYQMGLGSNKQASRSGEPRAPDTFICQVLGRARMGAGHLTYQLVFLTLLTLLVIILNYFQLLVG